MNSKDIKVGHKYLIKYYSGDTPVVVTGPKEKRPYSNRFSFPISSIAGEPNFRKVQSDEFIREWTEDDQKKLDERNSELEEIRAEQSALRNLLESTGIAGSLFISASDGSVHITIPKDQIDEFITRLSASRVSERN